MIELSAYDTEKEGRRYGKSFARMIQKRKEDFMDRKSFAHMIQKRKEDFMERASRI